MSKGVATEFRRNEKVRALDDLPGVPKGTEGRVLLVAGFTWTRYRVAFDNGFATTLAWYRQRGWL